MTSGLVRGLLAGAAGTTALNAVTYADMAVRGRGASDSPEQVVLRSADRVGVRVPGRGAERDNRTEALGALSGIAAGFVVGAVTGVVHRFLERRRKAVPAVVAVPLIAGAALALSDVPLTALGVSDARTWTTKDWASDIVPHLVYGVAVYASLHAGDDAADPAEDAS